MIEVTPGRLHDAAFPTIGQALSYRCPRADVLIEIFRPFLGRTVTELTNTWTDCEFGFDVLDESDQRLTIRVADERVSGRVTPACNRQGTDCVLPESVQMRWIPAVAYVEPFASIWEIAEVRRRIIGNRIARVRPADVSIVIVFGDATEVRYSTARFVDSGEYFLFWDFNC